MDDKTTPESRASRNIPKLKIVSFGVCTGQETFRNVLSSILSSLSQNKDRMHPSFFPHALFQQFVSRSMENKYQEAPNT